MEPNFIVYEIKINDFIKKIDEFLLNEKNIKVPFNIDLSDSHDSDKLTDVFFSIDIDEIEESQLEKMKNEFGQIIFGENIFKSILSEIFSSNELTYDYKTKANTFIIKIPFTNYKKSC